VSRRLSGPFDADTDADADGFGSALPLSHPASTGARAAAVVVTAKAGVARVAVPARPPRTESP
jgi:hypothetical protein